MKPANHVTNLKCFPQVAAVIGHAKAQHELFLAMINIKGENDYFDDNKELAISFIWTESPQGRHFWSGISVGRSPYKANA